MGKTQSINFTDSAEQVVEDWRKQQDKIPSFNEAVNTMLERYGAILALNQLETELQKQ